MRERALLLGCKAYDPQELKALVDRAFQEFSVYDRLRPGMTVVLKPNLILASKPEEAIITHPAFTAAVGRCVLQTGARALVAESPGGPYTPAVMRAVYRACGYQRMAEETGVELYTQCKYRPVHLPEGKRCRQANIIEPLLDRGFLIDQPQLKTHGMVKYSGGVKNLFGAVPGLQKPELHARFPEKENFCEMLVDLCAFLKPDLCLMDGIWAMEGNGPTGGQRRDLGVFIASNSPYAADVVGAAVAGMNPEDLDVLRLAAQRGLGPCRLDEVEALGEAIEGHIAADFKPAQASSTDFIDRLPGFLRPAAKKFATPYPKIDQKRCVGCGKCAESCPQHTIALTGGRARIDYKNCIRCFCCHEMCPKHVVKLRRLAILKL